MLRRVCGNPLRLNQLTIKLRHPTSPLQQQVTPHNLAEEKQKIKQMYKQFLVQSKRQEIPSDTHTFIQRLAQERKPAYGFKDPVSKVEQDAQLMRTLPLLP
jgi:hypothetical protein